MAEQDIDPASLALAAAENDPWTPACVARAFLDGMPEATPPRVGPFALGPVTMLAWLRLEFARSPFITGEEPVDDAARLHALCFAISVLCGKEITQRDLMGALDGCEAVSAWDTVSLRINDAFSTALPMKHVPKPGEPTPPEPRDHGFGWWVRVLTKCVSELGMKPNTALFSPLPQIFALLATHGVLEGMEPKEMNWKERSAMDVLEREEADAR